MITPALLRLFAVAAGIAVGNITIAQPLLDELAGAFSISSASAGLIVTMTQVGYGVGLVFLVPLGDTVDRRRLVVTQSQLSAVALAVIAAAPTTPILLAGMAALGLLAVMTQVLVAFAASLAEAHDRGRVIGTVTSGVVLGIVAARTLAGVTSDVWGWRAAYLAAAVLTSSVGWLLRRSLPTVPPTERSVPYRQLVASMASLMRHQPVLRTRAALAAVIFGTLNVLWSSLALALTSASRPLSNGSIGLFGLVGLAGAIAARRAGRLADRGLGDVTTGVALAAMVLAWLPIALLDQSLGLLVLGLLVLDGTVQAVHVTSQSMIADAVPDARSRAVAAYMVFYAVGSAGGSLASTATYASAGWLGVSVLGAALSAAGLGIWLAPVPRRSRRSAGRRAGDGAHDVAGRRDFVDVGHASAGPDDADVGVVGNDRPPIVTALGVEVGTEGSLASVPPLHRCVDDGSPGVAVGPLRAAEDVEHGGPARRRAAHELALRGVGVEGFAAGVEAGPDHDTGGAQRHRPLAFGCRGDASGGEHRNGRDGGCQRREQHGQALDVPSVATGLVALGDDDIGAGVGNPAGFGDGLDLAHGDGAGVVHDVEVGPRIAEREPHPAHTAM